MNASTEPSADLSPRDRILHTAHDLFYGEGIRATGIDKIIEQARVTKVTFYRQFPSKGTLVLAYLAYRHANWMTWLRDSLDAHQAQGKPPLNALLLTMDSWFSRPDFRGCAFLNATAELGERSPEVMDAVRQHKQDMASALADLLPKGPGRAAKGRALALAVDGAILQAQMAMPTATVLEGLRLLARPLMDA